MWHGPDAILMGRESRFVGLVTSIRANAPDLHYVSANGTVRIDLYGRLSDTQSVGTPISLTTNGRGFFLSLVMVLPSRPNVI